MKYAIFFVSLLFFMLLGIPALCQGNGGGGNGFGAANLYDVEVVSKCDFDNGAYNSFYTLLVTRNGSIVSQANYEADFVTPYVPNGTVTIGACVPNDDEYIAFAMCDNGTSFVRVQRVTNGTLANTADYLPDLTTVYTPIAVPTMGSCSSVTYDVLTVYGVVTSGTGATPANYAQMCFLNEGATNATVGGVALSPGVWKCFGAYTDPVTNKFRRVPSIVYDGLGNQLTIHGYQ